jgi:hypothetical protein
MLSSAVVALFLALGVAGWTYSKVTRRSGGIAKSDITVTVIVGLLAFFVAWTVFNMLPNGK